MVIQLNLSLQTPPQYKHLIVDSSLVCKDTKLCTIPTPIYKHPFITDSSPCPKDIKLPKFSTSVQTPLFNM